MAQWRKVIVSGSKAELNNISSSGDFVMSKDGAAMKFGNDNEVTLTHVHDNGLLLSDGDLVNYNLLWNNMTNKYYAVNIHPMHINGDLITFNNDNICWGKYRIRITMSADVISMVDVGQSIDIY